LMATGAAAAFASNKRLMIMGSLRVDDADEQIWRYL
jgi:hypothetical protein